MALLTIFHKLAILDREIIDEQYVNPTYFSKTCMYSSIISLEIYTFISTLKYRCNPKCAIKMELFLSYLKLQFSLIRERRISKRIFVALDEYITSFVTGNEMFHEKQ